MFSTSQGFSSFSAGNISECKQFYSQILGLKVTDQMGGLQLELASGAKVFIYPKDDHAPASFTVLNFPVEDIDKAVDGLTEKGVKLEHYDGFDTDEKGIAPAERPEDGPSIAWFKDPAGNILSVLQAH